ncbi:MAG TPA: hypothetical protein VK963_01180 [Candidatus Saccharimonadales bacterium]|nr:hypothetical protein [Candidatus Saccharimonadales bacterium]
MTIVAVSFPGETTLSFAIEGEAPAVFTEGLTRLRRARESGTVTTPVVEVTYDPPVSGRLDPDEPDPVLGASFEPLPGEVAFWEGALRAAGIV